jgi:hypothetical protein
MPGRHIDDVIAEKQRELFGRLDQSLRIMGQGQMRANQAERRALLRELKELERKRGGGMYARTGPRD